MRREKTILCLLIIAIVAAVYLAGCMGPKDSDKDGVPDEDDRFPNDPKESIDSDNDGVGDNSDAFPHDSSETADTDGDGYGDNSDDFPNDPNEWLDTDGDGYGDNSDVFPDDWKEWADTDGDGYGDNSDDFPNDRNYHLICPECNGTGKVLESKDFNYTASGKIVDLGTINSEWHVFITVTNQDREEGTFKVQARIVKAGEELWSGEGEHKIGPGKKYKFDLSASGFDQSVNQGNLKYEVKPPSIVIGGWITCPVCNGTGKI